MFWRFNLPTSQIESLLDKEDITLQELLDEDDVLQECKAQNKRLIEFFVKDEVMEQLVDMVVKEPSEDQDEKTRFKYPNTACELLTSDVQLITDKLSSEASLVDKLYAFLDTDQPLNPLLASFVSKIMGLLITRKSQMIFEFLKEKASFVARLLYHLDTSAVMDLLLRLITCIDNSEVKLQVLQWLNDERLIHRLAGLIHHSQSESKHCNAAQSLCDIIRLGREQMSQMQERAEPDALLEAVESREAISELLQNMLEGEARESVLTSGISVLLTLLEKKRQGVMIECMDGVSDTTELDDERYDASVDRTVSALLPRLPELHRLLGQPPKQIFCPMATSIGVLNPPLGNTRLQVTKLLAKLVECHRVQINQELATLGTLPVLLDLFFQYEWNSFLHCQVCSLLSCVLSSPPQQSTQQESGKQPGPLLEQLFNGCGILQRILQQWEENEDYQSRPDGHRKGYMGHLCRLANEVVSSSENESSPIVRNLIEEVDEEVRERWSSFVSTKLADINRKNKPDVVGGPRFSSSEDDDRDFEGIAFPQEGSMQQAFSDYQMQQMTSTFTEQFGFSEEELGEQEGRLDAAFSDRLSSIDFNISTSEETSQAASLFVQACQDRVQKIDDPDSDEDIWEDKQKEFTFSSSLQNSTVSSLGNTAPCARPDDDSSSDSEEDLDSVRVLRGKPDNEVEQSQEQRTVQEKMDTEDWPETLDDAAMESGPVAMETSTGDEHRPEAKLGWTEVPTAKSEDDDWADFTTASSANAPEDVDEESHPVTPTEQRRPEVAAESEGCEPWANFSSLSAASQVATGSESVSMDVQESNASDKAARYAVEQGELQEEDLPPRPSRPEPPADLFQPDELLTEGGSAHELGASPPPQTKSSEPVGSPVISSTKLTDNNVDGDVVENITATDTPGDKSNSEADEPCTAENSTSDTPVEKANTPVASSDATCSADISQQQSSEEVQVSKEGVDKRSEGVEELQENYNFLAGLMGRSTGGTDAEVPNGPSSEGTDSQQKLEKIRSEALEAQLEFDATTKNGPV